MKVVYATQDFPKSWPHSIFLAGPTPRDPETPSWRPEALRLLEEMGYEGVVFVPEPEDGQWTKDYTQQAGWEREGTQFADTVLFWCPRDLVSMPAFTTNTEFGRYVATGKAVWGHPDAAPKTRYQDWLNTVDNGDIPICLTLEETLRVSIAGWEDCPIRTAGERYVSAVVFQTPMFQSWYAKVLEVGNRLDFAEILWTFQLKGRVFSYVMKVHVWIASEGRMKANEWIFARTDIAAVVAYYLPPDFTSALDAKIVLVREFRSPARTQSGFIHELPGGGCEAADDGARDRARAELHEETGIILDKGRFFYVGSRQGIGTVSTHQIHCYTVPLTREEYEQALMIEESGEAHGEDGPGGEEQAYVEVRSLGELLENPDYDWSTLGLITAALKDAPNR
jgi:ADP-ribose pyrophosphatase YjhB (NUDIX family)